MVAVLVLFFLSSITSTCLAVLHGGEADHTLEECLCCLPTPDCLINLGPGANFSSSSTNKTHQHLLFSTMQRELHRAASTFENGHLPSFVGGSLFKNGFGMFETPQYEFLSVFDAMGYALRVQLFPENNTMQVTAKFTKSDWFQRSTEGKQIPPYRSFMGTNPPLSFAENLKLMSTIVPDNLNVNLVRQGDKLLAISDMDGFNELDFDTLELLQYFQYSDGISMTTSIASVLGVLTSAHPVITASEPHIVYNFVGSPGSLLPRFAMVPTILTAFTLFSTRAMLKSVQFPSYNKLTFVLLMACIASMVYWCFLAIDGHTPAKVNEFTIYRLDTSKHPLERKPLVSIPVHVFTYLHEMAITDRSIVLMEWPTTWNIQSIASPLFNDPSKLQLHWKPWLGTRITVVDKDSGNVTAEISSLGPYWSYHHIGAFEDDTTITVDACTYNSGEHLHTFELRTLRANTWQIPPNINRRFVINKMNKSSSVKVKNVGPVGFDLPVRNPEYLGSKYKFAYGTGHRNAGEWWNTLVKVDMDTGVTLQWYEEETWPSQPVFVANPLRRSEDDGVLIVVMLDGKRRKSFVLVLDANTMLELCRAYVDIVLPYTSHGYFDVDKGGNGNATTIPGLKNGFVPSRS